MYQNNFEELFSFLNLGEIISSPSKAVGGLLHEVWKIETATHDFALKKLSKHIIERQGVKASYEQSEKVARNFVTKGIPAVPALIFNDQCLVDFEDDVFLIYNWIDGSILPEGSIYPQQASKVAEILAKIHSQSKLDEPVKANFHLISSEELKNIWGCPR